MVSRFDGRPLRVWGTPSARGSGIMASGGGVASRCAPPPNNSVKRTAFRRRLLRALALMKTILLLSVLLYAICSPTGARASSSAVAALRDGFVLSAVIRYQCARAAANGDTKYMILAPNSASIDTPVIAKPHDRNAVASLKRRNSKTQLLPRNISISCFKSLSAAKLAAALPNGNWQHFHSVLPNAWGIFYLSLPGYSQDGTTALVQGSQQCGPMCANGFYWVLRLVNGKWQVVSSEPTWIS